MDELNLGLTFKGFNDLKNLDYVPGVGEVIMEVGTSYIKIGDGKTPIFELPYVSTSVKVAPAPPRKYKLSDNVKNFIEKYIDFIEAHRFDEVYGMIINSPTEFIRDFTRALLEAGINPKPHLTRVPRCIQDLLLDSVDNLDNKMYIHNYDDWSLDYSQMYTTSEIDAKLHEIIEECTKKMYNAMSIPAHHMTIKTGEN